MDSKIFMLWISFVFLIVTSCNLDSFFSKPNLKSFEITGGDSNTATDNRSLSSESNLVYASPVSTHFELRWKGSLTSREDVIFFKIDDDDFIRLTNVSDPSLPAIRFISPLEPSIYVPSANGDYLVSAPNDKSLSMQNLSPTSNYVIKVIDLDGNVIVEPISFSLNQPQTPNVFVGQLDTSDPDYLSALTVNVNKPNANGGGNIVSYNVFIKGVEYETLTQVPVGANNSGAHIEIPIVVAEDARDGSIEGIVVKGLTKGRRYAFAVEAIKQSSDDDTVFINSLKTRLVMEIVPSTLP